jgi:hypothetical protein
MIKKPSALRATPSKAQVYEVFNRLFQAWPKDPLRPGRSIQNLKPLTPENPNFDERHTFYQSAAMKIILLNRLQSHVWTPFSGLFADLVLQYKLSNGFMKPQAVPDYYTKLRERLDRDGLPGAQPSRWQRFLDFLAGKERPIQ